MEELKHECGVALIRLKKPLEYYKQQYGTYNYGLNKLYILMEKQRNRGQEGAGIASVKLNAQVGEEYMFREREEGKDAITNLFASIHKQQSESGCAIVDSPFTGECYMGHLRYSTTGRSGISYVHPMLRRQYYRHTSLAICGNFNLTNVDEIFEKLKSEGQHPRRTNDTTVVLEQLGCKLDNTPLQNGRLEKILKETAPTWDGGYVMCGLVGNGEMYAVRDPWGIRTAFYYEDDEIVVIASERPVIQTAMNVNIEDIHEIRAGEAIMISENGELSKSQICHTTDGISPCSFERIYFSRGSDSDIYKERKLLGASITSQILKEIDYDLKNSVVSFIPNTAETAFYGMCEGLNTYLDLEKQNQLLSLKSPLNSEEVLDIIAQRVRIEKVAIKDVKLRTFISENGERNELANHVYDITYGSIVSGNDNLIVIDDSIVRGTTMKQSIITILSRLNPRKLIIVSSAPQIRYPDYYGIDMSNIGDLIAFRAAVELKSKSEIDAIYQKCINQRNFSSKMMKNYVQEVYEGLSNEQISDKITELVTPSSVKSPIKIIFQELDALHRVCPNHLGDWYFSGNYPTNGGVKLLNESFIKFYETIFFNL